MSVLHDERRCPTGYGCMCDCTSCVTHCGPADRSAAWFCVTQGVVPIDKAVRAARALRATITRP